MQTKTLNLSHHIFKPKPFESKIIKKKLAKLCVDSILKNNAFNELNENITNKVRNKRIFYLEPENGGSFEVDFIIQAAKGQKSTPQKQSSSKQTPRKQKETEKEEKEQEENQQNEDQNDEDGNEEKNPVEIQKKKKKRIPKVKVTPPRMKMKKKTLLGITVKPIHRKNKKETFKDPKNVDMNRNQVKKSPMKKNKNKNREQVG